MIGRLAKLISTFSNIPCFIFLLCSNLFLVQEKWTLRLFLYLLVLSEMSIVTVGAGDYLFRTIFVEMFLQKSLLKFSSAVVHTQDFRVLAIRVNVILKHKQSVLDVKYQSKPITARQSLRPAKWIDRAYPGFRSTKRLHVEVLLFSPEWDASLSQGFPQH